MALLTVSLAAVGLATSTMVVTASSRIEPVEEEADVIVCENVAYGYQRTLPAGARCSARAEVEVTPVR